MNWFEKRTPEMMLKPKYNYYIRSIGQFLSNWINTWAANKIGDASVLDVRLKIILVNLEKYIQLFLWLTCGWNNINENSHQGLIGAGVDRKVRKCTFMEYFLRFILLRPNISLSCTTVHIHQHLLKIWIGSLILK